MTDAERIRKLAEWMGFSMHNWSRNLSVPAWCVDEYHCHMCGRTVHTNSPPREVCVRNDWNPLTRIQDAWMLVEKLTTWELQKHNSEQFRLIIPGRIIGFWVDTAPLAICAAIEKLMEESHVPKMR